MLRGFLRRVWRARHLGGGRLRIAIALVMVVGASALFWTSRDYTVVAPEWDGQVRGIAYNPSHIFSLKQNKDISPERIDRDLAQISKLTGHIRTYTVDGGMDKVPEIARRYGMTVSMGIWISPDLEQNEKSIELGIKTALANRRTIDRVIVGNETQLEGYVSPDQLNDYIQRVRAALPARIKITTAEPWSTWMLTPEIGQYVDVVFVHLLPYWENVDIRGSLKSIEGFYNHIQSEFPDKQIVVGEATYALPVADVIDLKAEGVRLQKEIKKLADEVAKIDAKLANAAFVSRAPEEVVEEQRERRSQAEQTRERLSTALKRLGV